MSLQSFSFILFMPIVVGVNFLIPRKYRYIWLFFASSFFYLSQDVRCMPVLACCIGTTYVSGLLLQRGSEIKRKGVLACCILLNVSTLLLFRYSYLKSLLVPIGLSFYSLQAMGYVIDVYRHRIEAERNLARYAVFVSFFPTVLSGPIQRGTGLLQQLKEGRDFDYTMAHAGLYSLLWGYLLKILLANPLGKMVDFAYGNYETLPGATLLWATILYAVQLYCDFAGYSALAIGAGKLLGFDLGENFMQPYFATSVRDFWKRWHISLSSWLKDYVYISLGGNRKGKGRKYLNLLATFLISGLWHGSGLNFLVWGGLHGIYQIAESGIRKREKVTKPFQRVLQSMITFALVDFAWLFFRADSLSQAFAILYRIFFRFRLKEMTYYGSYLLGGTKQSLLLLLVGIGVVLLIDFLHEKGISLEKDMACRIPVVIRWGIYTALTLCILLAVVRNYGQAASTFIYTRF